MVVMRMKIGAVIVAAGMSGCMKDFKERMKMGDLSAAERVVVNFQRAGIKDIVMVTGYQAKEVEKALHRFGITFLRNEKYEATEMFDSVKIGLGYLADRCDQILFCPADIPFFTVETVRALLEQEGDFVIPVYYNRAGHPVRIASTIIPRVLEYQGNGGLEGAAEYLKIRKVFFEVMDEGAVTDADAQEDYHHLLASHNARLKRPQVRVSLAGKQAFFDSDTVNLMRHIRCMGAVREACERSGISYSQGWSIIQTAERELGYRIVERRPGGPNGGRAFLTKRGEDLLSTFESFENSVEEAAQILYQQFFSETDLL